MRFVLTADVLQKAQDAVRSSDPRVRDAGETLISWLTLVLKQSSVPLDERVQAAWELIDN